jgi:hypothetical protein
MVCVMAMPTHCEGRGGGGWRDWEGRRAVDLQRSLNGEKKGKGRELRLRGGEMGARVSPATETRYVYCYANDQFDLHVVARSVGILRAF